MSSKEGAVQIPSLHTHSCHTVTSQHWKKTIYSNFLQNSLWPPCLKKNQKNQKKPVLCFAGICLPEASCGSHRGHWSCFNSNKWGAHRGEVSLQATFQFTQFYTRELISEKTWELNNIGFCKGWYWLWVLKEANSKHICFNSLKREGEGRSGLVIRSLQLPLMCS